MKWTEQMEARLLELKDRGLQISAIAHELGVTESSVKHKYTRLQQRANEDSHHHPTEKLRQIENLLAGRKNLRILETHAGFGNLTEVYNRYAREVIAFELDAQKCAHIQATGWNKVNCIQADSLRGIHKLLYQRDVFDVVDVDPYGYPSRYFPNVLELINDGILFVTFPKYGCAQINKITQLHVSTFYEFSGGSNEEFVNKCIEMIQKQALRSYREIEVLGILDLKKVYRVAVRVQKRNALILCGYGHLARKE